MSFWDKARQKLYIIGGCRGPKDHINDIQIFDHNK